MIEPNFGEIQLQQCINTEFTLWALQEHKVFASAAVPTLHDEALLGWDSGFFFPWLPYGPLSSHMGCNFFLQYKLSTLIEGPRGKQYADWGTPYMRFQIPHETKDNGHHLTDFHQYDALRDLARNNCKVYYATNQVTTRNELFALAGSQNLIANTPFLDVHDVTESHFYVTFTASSAHFLLHSDAKEVRRVSGEQLKKFVDTGELRTIAEDNALVFEVLSKHLAEVKGGERFLMAYQTLDHSHQEPPELRSLQKFFLLRSLLSRFFNITMVRFWRMER